MSTKTLTIIGWVASIGGMIMYLSFIDQAQLNIQGNKGSLFVAGATFVNCIFWCIYGRGKKDNPVFFANLLGLFTSLAAIFTYFM